MSNIQNTYDKLIKRIKSVKNIITTILCNNSINEHELLYKPIENASYIVKKFYL